MPGRRRSAGSPPGQPPVPEDRGSSPVATADDDIVRPAHPTNWLGAVLLEQGSITPEQLDEALLEQAESGGRLGEVLVRREVLTEAALARGLAEQLELPVIDLGLRTPQPEALEHLPEHLVRKYKALPMAVAEGELYVAVSGPIADSVLRELTDA